MELDVWVMSGAGNIFTIIDNTNSRFNDNFFIRNAFDISKHSFFCNPTDGIIVIEKDETGISDFKMKFFNLDGTYGMMCGNGGRCAVLYAYLNDIIHKNKQPIVFDVWGTKYFAYFKDNKIEIVFPPPLKVELNKFIETSLSFIKGDYIDVNTPHFVIHRYFPHPKDFFKFELSEFARMVNQHDDFKPNGVNVNIFTIVDDKIYLRTYEKGGPGETGACGTGAIATAISLFMRDKTKTKFEIVPPSKENLYVELITDKKHNIQQILLSGDARLLHKAKIDYYPG